MEAFGIAVFIGIITIAVAAVALVVRKDHASRHRPPGRRGAAASGESPLWFPAAGFGNHGSSPSGGFGGGGSGGGGGGDRG
ncbi:hypothetical protein HER39_16270 [Arthrobacter deserti]|uniref:TPM domain-containing protein n=1 Tax=Arthrobacter deserti TaxID=1742687 RepID=A0ABX1JS23_9MICC|nr:hypothetical protein [Arthrobacter deserti]